MNLSIAGFDDAASAGPLGLTTIRQPIRPKGELAAHALLSLLEGHPAGPPQLLPTQLVIRFSTRSPANG